jgi:hypothetical protein
MGKDSMKNAFFWIVLSLASCYTSYNEAEHEGIEAREVLQLISRDQAVILKGKTIKGDLDFTKIDRSFPVSEHASQVEITSPLYFQNCVFEGQVIGFKRGESHSAFLRFHSNLVFINCIFEGKLDLSHARFNGIFTLSGSEVKGEFNISNATFLDESTLRATNFKDDIKLSYTTFYQTSNCMDLEVGGKTYLQGAHYFKDVLWSNSIFSDYVDISKLTSASTFTLDHCKFNGPLFLSGSHFWNILNLSSCSFNDEVTIRTCVFMNKPIIDSNHLLRIVFEKNKHLIDENLRFPSIKK